MFHSSFSHRYIKYVHFHTLTRIYYIVSQDFSQVLHFHIPTRTNSQVFSQVLNFHIPTRTVSQVFSQVLQFHILTKNVSQVFSQVFKIHRFFHRFRLLHVSSKITKIMKRNFHRFFHRFVTIASVFTGFSKVFVTSFSN